MTRRTARIGNSLWKPALLMMALAAGAPAYAQWTVLIPDSYRGEEAIRAALDDLEEAGANFGIAFEVASAPCVGDPFVAQENTILVGGPGVNTATKYLQSEGKLTFDGVAESEGYEISTIATGPARVMALAGGSVLGDAYGIYWIRDRLLVNGQLPDINMRRAPALGIRYTRIEVRSEEDIRRALSYGLNTVYGENPLRLIPWNAEPERTENEVFRKRTRELAAYAHSMHMRFMAMGTDFTYHPSLLEEFGATLTPDDPRFWDAVQAKYRMLFDAMPELDGVTTFTADEQSYWGNYRTFDVMHGGVGCEWPLEKRYRTFVKKVWEVVVGEHDKIYFNRTWATNVYEQQARPEVFARIFTDEVPTKNLYLIPSFTQNDRWWFQDYNPTINQTPHRTMVVCETMDYHGGEGFFPTYPGAYFQAGLETMLDVPHSNLSGLSLDLPASDDWQTRSLTAYTVSRLAWDYHEDVREIARDFASIHFGPKAAEGMGDLLLRSASAYKYGLYIEPTVYGEFSSLPLIRVGQFNAQGYPLMDGGKAQMELLRRIYLKCKPWIPETHLYLEHGLNTIQSMKEGWLAFESALDRAQADEVSRALNATELLIRTNNEYVKTIFAYFAYRDEPSSENRAALETSCEKLRATADALEQAPGASFLLYGVDQLLLNAQLALKDLEGAVHLLQNAPSSDETELAVQKEEARYKTILEEFSGEAVKILHWRGKIDGTDVVRMKGSDVSIQHYSWDGPQVERAEVISPLPQHAGTVLVRSIATRPLHPFVLEQPSAANGFTVEILLSDAPGGGDWWEFELLFLDKSPAELGIRDSLKARR
ncbi:MAG: hypothetical protein IT364_12495 [Candidatus Hydrogenedentes bacterium]|nr:hypothetical protein [Candidatus Hydrogenedentota bacterium]